MVQGSGSRQPNQGAILADNFGGLNRTNSPLNIPMTDSPYLLNVDIDVSGKVRKRKGTRTFWTEPNDDNRISVSEVQTNLGHSFIISKLNQDLRIHLVDNDDADLVWSRTGVFLQKTGDVDFVNIPGETVRILMLNGNHTPIQVQVHEFQFTPTSLGTVVPVPTLYQTLGISTVFINKNPVQFTYSGGAAVTLATSFNVGDYVDIITFSWQWLAESYYYFGDNFHRSVSRAGAVLNDQNVSIPVTINSNIKNSEEPDNYGILAFVNNGYDNQYLYRPDRKPETSFEYSFGDGATYRYEDDNSVTPSPFFVTFGREASSIKFNVSSSNINVTTNILSVKAHGLQTDDIVRFTNDEGLIPPLVIDTPYYVERINDDQFILYNDEARTSVVNFTPPPFVTFTDAEIDEGLNRINIAHPFPVGSITRINFQNPDLALPVGISAQTSYYAFALTNSILEIYFDRFATRRVDLLARREIYMLDSGVVPNPQNSFSSPSNLLFAQDGFRIYPYPGSTLPTGVVAGQLYFVEPLDPSNFTIFNDKLLTSPVAILDQGSGQFYGRLDGGLMRLQQDYGETTLEKNSFNKVDFVRLRELKFNGEQGFLGSDLYVTVNDVQVAQNTSGVGSPTRYLWELYNNGTSKILSSGATAFRIGFTGSEEIGLPQNAIVKISYRTPRWVGVSATNLPFNNNNGSWVPIYGVSQYCNYLTGEFFAVGTVFQSRLILGGLKTTPQQVLFSSKSALNKAIDFWYFFQIAEDNTTPAIDPFDIIIPEQNNYTIQRIIEWQRALYVFTDNSVFRTFSQEGNVTIDNRVVGKVAEKGAVNPRCVTITESSVLFLSDTGVYDLSPVLENEYRAAEASIKIKPFFGLTSNLRYKSLPWIAFDDVNLRVYVGLPAETDVSQASVLLVYDTLQVAWTEYSTFYKFRTFMGLSYFDVTLGKQFMVAHKLPCFLSFTRFNYTEYLDFARSNLITGGVNRVPTVPVFWKGETFNGVSEYIPDLTMLFLPNVQDVRVYYSTNNINFTELVWQTQWVKTNSNSIRLNFNPVNNGRIAVVPRVEDGFFGTILKIDNIEEILSDDSFGTIDFSNPCVCQFTIGDPGGYGGGSTVFLPCSFTIGIQEKAVAGYAYHAVYVSPLLNSATIAELKRINAVNIMFENIRDRFKPEDVNTFTQVYSTLVNRQRNKLQASVGVVYQSDNRAEMSADVYDRPNVEPFDAWTVFKERLRGVGYSYQVVVWSLDAGAWVMAGYEVSGDLVGRRHHSGDRT